MSIGYSPKEIQKLRKNVHDQWIAKTGKKANFSSITSKDLKVLFDLIDEYFFNSEIRNKIKSINTTLKFCVDKAPKRGGVCKKRGAGKQCTYELCVSEKIMNEIFSKNEEVLRANGIECRDRLSCLQLTFEHEIMHLIMFLWEYYTSRRVNRKGITERVHKSHGKLFKCMVHYFYGHTTSTHELIAGDEKSWLSRKDFKVGDRVYYFDKGERVHAIIQRLNPETALLATQDGKGLKLSYSAMFKDDEVVEFVKAKSKKDFSVGERIYVEINGKKVKGTIQKLNPTRAVIVLENGKKGAAPYSLLFKL